MLHLNLSKGRYNFKRIAFSLLMVLSQLIKSCTPKNDSVLFVDDKASKPVFPQGFLNSAYIGDPITEWPQLYTSNPKLSIGAYTGIKDGKKYSLKNLIH